eukprot:3690223-Amphidinium_carterae.1
MVDNSQTTHTQESCTGENSPNSGTEQQKLFVACHDRLNADMDLLDRVIECEGFCGPQVDVAGSV